ncbi:unnamed protein product [Paramecium octaurelia]|uniref:Uncharacterized protein n=1 Tax=Paramecium octaurelia TaxID=43137 RepID=A0A8S1YK85_PAROT|nr:unnamed protein product [Paramecium octaurelia]
MHHKKEQVEVLYEVLSLSNEVEVFLPILINTLKKERIQNCLKFLSQDQNKFLLEIESQKQKTNLCLRKNRLLMKRRILRQQQMSSKKLWIMTLINRITLRMIMKNLKRIQSQKQH